MHEGVVACERGRHLELEADRIRRFAPDFGDAQRVESAGSWCWRIKSAQATLRRKRRRAVMDRLASLPRERGRRGSDEWVWLRNHESRRSDRLEVLERFPACLAAVQRLAGGRAELGQSWWWCAHHNVGKAVRRDEAQRLSHARWRSTQAERCRALQLRTSFRSDPVAGPCRRQPRLHGDAERACALQRFADGALDQLGRRAAGVGGRDDDLHAYRRWHARRARCRARRPRSPGAPDPAPAAAPPRLLLASARLLGPHHCAPG